MGYLPFSAFPRLPWKRGTKWVLCSVLGLVLAAAGCGGSSTGSISGKVFYKDAPLKGGNVTFATKDKKVVRLSEISEDGSYSIEKMPTGDALIAVDTSSLQPPKMERFVNKPPPGVEAPAGYKMDNPAERAKRYVAIPEQYADPEKSGLTCPVKKGKQQFDINLK